MIGPLVRAHPGLRVPGQVDGDEIAIRTVIGQQVSVVGRVHGRPAGWSPSTGARSSRAIPGLTHLFPDAADPRRRSTRPTLPMPRARGRALVGLAPALAVGDVALDRGPDRDDVRRALLELPGIGPWTADYVAMRALAHPDVFLPTDVGVRNALSRPGHDPAPVIAGQRALAAVALLRPDAPVEHPDAAGAPADAGSRDRRDRGELTCGP